MLKWFVCNTFYEVEEDGNIDIVISADGTW